MLNVFSVPRWVFLANGIKMTLKVPGAILARFENSDPLCGPTMENARIFNTHHGSKRPIMDPLNHAPMLMVVAGLDLVLMMRFTYLFIHQATIVAKLDTK